MFCWSLFVLLYFFFWPLFCLFFFDIRILITSLWYLLSIVLSVLLRYTDSDYSFGIFWPLCCLFFFFWPLCCLFFCLLTIVLSVLRYTDSDYPFGIFKLFLLQRWATRTPHIIPGEPSCSPTIINSRFL
jgi:hypothetical protein